MAEPEKKPDVNPTPPAGNDGNPPAPNQGPSVEELQKQNQELLTQVKDRDGKIADLSTSVATIEERMRQINAQPKSQVNQDTQAKVKSILDKAQYDVDGAASDMSTLLSEMQQGSTKDLNAKVSTIINQQNVISELRKGVKDKYSDLDDDIIDTIMERANMLATVDKQTNANKFKSAQEPIEQAAQFVISKLDAYAKKKNATPPLPPGASAESGPNNPPPPPPTPEKVQTPLEELETRKKGLQSKII